MVQGERRDDIRVFTYPQLSRLLLDRDERDETLEALCQCDELLIDDVGAGYTKVHGFVASCLEEAFIVREASNSPVFVTTNLSPKEFQALLGTRVYDRIRGDWGLWLKVDGPSLREKRRTAR
jgi:DNA replication protein DnaC